MYDKTEKWLILFGKLNLIIDVKKIIDRKNSSIRVQITESVSDRWQSINLAMLHSIYGEVLVIMALIVN